MQRSKAEGYIGFCIKAGKLTCGFNAVQTLKKGVYLLLLCSTASANAKKEAEKLRARFRCAMIESCGRPLEDIVGRANCKLAAVRDENLAKAILSVTDDEFRKYSGGNI